MTTNVLEESEPNTTSDKLLEERVDDPTEEGPSLGPAVILDLSTAAETSAMPSMPSPSVSPVSEIRLSDLRYIANITEASSLAIAPASPAVLNDDFSWTFEGDFMTTHVKRINYGGSGEVHMVCLPIQKTLNLICIDAKYVYC